MDLYTLQQADYLISFYADKIVGQILEQSTRSVVDYLDKEPYGNNQYRVIARGKMLPGNIFPKLSIDRVAKDLNLPSPQEVLDGRDKHQDDIKS